MKLRFRLYRSSYPEAVNTWNGALEKKADLRVNERQKIRHYRARSTEEEEEEEGEITGVSDFLIRTARP